MNPHHNPRGPMLDMREYARRVVELTADQTEKALGPGGDWRFQASLERLLETIGEAANRVPKDVQVQFTQDPVGDHHRDAEHPGACLGLG